MAAAENAESPHAKLAAEMVTDVGVVRDHNEDAAYVDSGRQFFIVADGMGGHAAGEVASAMAVDTVRKTLEAARPRVAAFARKPSEDGRRELVQLLQGAVLAAHQAVFQRGSRESDKQGMGTTLDVLLVAGAEAFVAHVGDSRTYLIRDGRASQITTDHTVAEVLVIEGKLTIEEAQVSPLRTILVNAIGVSADVGVEMAHLQLRRGDRLLLCSDGLHDYFVAEQELADKLADREPGPALGELVELAKERGGHDNITGVVIDVLELNADGDGVPRVVEHEETLPVDSRGWSDDEHTESLSVREIAAAGEPGTTPATGEAGDASDDDDDSDEETRPGRPESTEPLPRQDPAELDMVVATRPTLPMKVVTSPEPEPEPGPAERERLGRATTVPPRDADEDDGADDGADGAGDGADGDGADGDGADGDGDETVEAPIAPPDHKRNG
jgi:serine/threonine protein phosphatase PrpC